MVYFEAWAYKKPVVALDLPSAKGNDRGGRGRDFGEE